MLGAPDGQGVPWLAAAHAARRNAGPSDRAGSEHPSSPAPDDRPAPADPPCLGLSGLQPLQIGRHSDQTVTGEVQQLCLDEAAGACNVVAS